MKPMSASRWQNRDQSSLSSLIERKATMLPVLVVAPRPGSRLSAGGSSITSNGRIARLAIYRLSPFGESGANPITYAPTSV